MNPLRRAVFVLMLLATVGAGAAPPGGDLQEPADSVLSRAPENAPLAAFRRELLDLAMDAASAIPHEPFIKDRSRAQHRVAGAALELDQPRLALRYMERIDNWRRGAVAAEYVLYCAKAGHVETIDELSRIARAAARLASQDWRRDYIHLRLAQARMRLGDPEPAERFRRTLQDDVFRGEIERTRAALSDDAGFDQVIARLDELIESGRYEPILNGAGGYIALYEQYFSSAERREQLERRLREAYERMPGPDTIDMLVRLAEIALEHDDPSHAESLLREAEEQFEAIAWSEYREYRSVYLSRLVRLRFRVGDRAGALDRLNGEAERLNERIDRMVDIWRADALRPIAEAYHVIGEGDRASRYYRRALEAGQININPRPKADDLAELCTSMARVGFEPSEDLWERLRQAGERLGGAS